MSAVHIVNMDQFSVRLNIIKLFNNLHKILKLSMKESLFKLKNTHSYFFIYTGTGYTPLLVKLHKLHLSQTI